MPMKILRPLVILFMVASPSASAITVLPNPTDTFDGLPVARQFDEFISFSTQLLTQFGYSGFSGATGVGGLDVVLLTQAGGTNNQNVGAAGNFDFEDPVSTPTGSSSTHSGRWGAGDQANGPVLVDDLLSYLQSEFGANASIPVFSFDLVEPGNPATRDLTMVANFQIWDPSSNMEVASWSLDAVDNGIYDPTQFITVQGQIELTGASSTVYTANNNGSGSADFLVYSPTMLLTNYIGQGYEFHISASFANLNGGGEEAFLLGALSAPPSAPVVPEPSSMILLGLGLAFPFLKRKLF